MTDAEAETLGRRLVACKGFRVMRGMLDMQGRTWGRDLLWRWRNDLDVPDLRDPATLGCLLALVREVHGPLACTYTRGDIKNEWSVRSVIHENYDGHYGDDHGYSERSEAEALVAALEAAP
jgi:hypothetical protein